MIKSGVYVIINTLTTKKYVGSAAHFQKRFNQHKSLLKRNIHPNIKLQRSWNKHGESAFEFSIVEFVENIKDLLLREQFHIDQFKATKNGNYNINPVAGSSLGRKTKESTKKLISSKLSGNNGYWYGKTFSDEHRKKVGDAERGTKHHYWGKHLSEEHRKKIGFAHQGEKCSNSKIKECDVLEIRSDYSKGNITQQQLADKYGIGRKAITKIINRQRWKHI